MLINTYTGKGIDFDLVSPADIEPYDIAHALSHICRFTGHVKFHYSVARHSILVHELVTLMSDDQTHRDYGLLHDTPEYLVGDLALPVKSRPKISVPYAELEERVSMTITTFFGVAPCSDMSAVPIIKMADKMALEMERRFHFPHTEADWVPDDYCHTLDDLLKREPSLNDHVTKEHSPVADRMVMMDRMHGILNRTRRADT